MIIPWDNLYNLPVESESGGRLGVVIGIDLEAETGSVHRYRVKSRGLIKGLLNDELLISPTQVISIDLDRMVVADSVTTEREMAGKKIAVAPSGGAEITSTLQSNKNQ
jgi:sporulation protein YlmC with PRC-barrel domain